MPGATTYRLFAHLNDPADRLSAVVGEGFDASWITSTEPFFQHPLGGSTPTAIDPVLFTLYPELEQRLLGDHRHRWSAGCGGQ